MESQIDIWSDNMKSHEEFDNEMGSHEEIVNEMGSHEEFDIERALKYEVSVSFR